MCRRSVSKDAYVLSDYDTGRDRESKGEVSVTSPALCRFIFFCFCNAFYSLIVNRKDSVSPGVDVLSTADRGKR